MWLVIDTKTEGRENDHSVSSRRMEVAKWRILRLQAEKHAHARVVRCDQRELV